MTTEIAETAEVIGCPKCNEVPCSCGYMYKKWPIKRLEHHIAMLQKALGNRRMAQSFAISKRVSGK